MGHNSPSLQPVTKTTGAVPDLCMVQSLCVLNQRGLRGLFDSRSLGCQQQCCSGCNYALSDNPTIHCSSIVFFGLMFMEMIVRMSASWGLVRNPRLQNGRAREDGQLAPTQLTLFIIKSLLTVHLTALLTGIKAVH